VLSVLPVENQCAGEPATFSGTLPASTTFSASHLAGADEWWQVIAAVQAEDWPATRRALITVLGQPGGAAIVAAFGKHHDPNTQLIVTVLAAGGPAESSGLIVPISLPAILVSPYDLRIQLK
jgi:hypothetical protein